MPRTPRFTLAAALLAGGGLAAAPAAAQAGTGPALTIAAGAMRFDLLGSGGAASFAFRADFPLADGVRVEASAMTAWPKEETGRSELLLREAQLQAQLPVGGVAPYVGGGVGLATLYRGLDENGDNLSRSFLTLSAAAGARVPLSGRFSGVVDGRVHGFGPSFGKSTAELTLGLRITLGEDRKPAASPTAP